MLTEGYISEEATSFVNKKHTGSEEQAELNQITAQVDNLAEVNKTQELSREQMRDLLSQYINDARELNEQECQKIEKLYQSDDAVRA